MERNHFIKRRKPPKKRKDHERRDGRQYIANKSDLRRQAYERARGLCEFEVQSGMRFGKPFMVRCNTDAPWDGPLTVRGHLAHKRHGIHRDDTLAGVLWGCANCHLEGDHGSKCTYPRRAGKVMKAAKAKEYWLGKVCFCSTPEKEVLKPAEASFCDECLAKLPASLRHDIENTEFDDYLKCLAECETAIQQWSVDNAPKD